MNQIALLISSSFALEIFLRHQLTIEPFLCSLNACRSLHGMPAALVLCTYRNSYNFTAMFWLHGPHPIIMAISERIGTLSSLVV